MGSARVDALDAVSTGRRLTVNSLDVFYRTAGKSGPYLLLIHGGGSDHSGFAWKLAIPALAERFRVIALDLPGYGKSDLPQLLGGADPGAPNAHTHENILAYHSEFVKGFLDALGIAKIHLLGFSMGGGISIRFALKHPQYIDKLILLNAYGLGEEVIGGIFSYLVTRVDPVWLGLRWLFRKYMSLVRMGLRWSVYDPATLSDDLVRDAWKSIRASRLHPAWRVFQHQEITLRGFRTVYADRLSELSCPVLYIHSENDRLIPVKYARRAHQLTPTAHLFIAGKAGHLLPREHPELFHRVVMDYLSDNFQAKTASVSPALR